MRKTAGYQAPLTSPLDPYLWRIHALAAILATTSAIAMASTATTSGSVSLVTNFPLTNSSKFYRDTAPKHAATVNISYFAIVFLGLSALQHALIAVPLWGWYKNAVAQRCNPLRWAEYSLSASIMHVLIASLCGIFDIHLLFAIFGLTATTMLFGLFAERSDDESVFWLGFIPYATQWLILACFFFYAVSKTAGVPDFVWSIFFVISLLDISFAVLALLGLRRVGKFADFQFVELSYAFLSLTSKQFLAWMTFQGTQRS